MCIYSFEQKLKLKTNLIQTSLNFHVPEIDFSLHDCPQFLLRQPIWTSYCKIMVILLNTQATNPMASQRVSLVKHTHIQVTVCISYTSTYPTIAQFKDMLHIFGSSSLKKADIHGSLHLFFNYYFLVQMKWIQGITFN